MFKSFRRSIGAAVATACMVATVAAVSGASAAQAEDKIDLHELPEQMQYALKLAHPISLPDAIRAAKEAQVEPVAYRFENVNLVGEFSPATGLPVDEFLMDTQDAYGVEPAVVQLILVDSTEKVKTHESRVLHTDIGSRFAEMKQNPIAPDSRIGTILAEDRSNATSTGLAPLSTSPTRWDPDEAQHMITREIWELNNTITGHYVWGDLDTAPHVLPAQHGLEFQVDVYTDNPSVLGTGRPNCSPVNYKDIPFAKNHSWTWSSYVGSPYAPGGVVTDLSALGVYADYNDLSDACNRNSISIGLATPQDIELPWMSIAYYFGFQIAAPKGDDYSGRVSAGVQTVSTHWCQSFPWMALTDCMGVWNSGYGDDRPVLGEFRNWVAPDLCWTSYDYGTTTPINYPCP